MKSKTRNWIIGGVVIVIAGGAVAYFFARNQISDHALERLQAQLEQAGSSLKWESREYRGNRLILENVEYLDGQEHMTMRADNLEIHPKGLSQFDIKLTDYKANFEKNGTFQASSILIGSWSPGSTSMDMAFASAELNNARWQDQNGDLYLQFEGAKFDNFANLKAEHTMFSELAIGSEYRHLEFRAPDISIEDFTLYPDNHPIIMDSFGFSDMKIPEFGGYWFDTSFLRGDYHAVDNLEDAQGYTIAGQSLLEASIDISQSDFTQNAKNLSAQAPFLLDMAQRLDVERYQGEILIEANYDENGNYVRFDRLNIVGLGALEFQSTINPPALRYLINGQGSVPDTRPGDQLLAANVEYHDEELADVAMDTFGVNPFTANIMLQFFGGQFLPNDRALVIAFSDALTEFIRGKNGFELAIANHPEANLEESLEVYDQTGSLQSALKIEFRGY